MFDAAWNLYIPCNIDSFNQYAFLHRVHLLKLCSVAEYTLSLGSRSKLCKGIAQERNLPHRYLHQNLREKHQEIKVSSLPKKTTNLFPLFRLSVVSSFLSFRSIMIFMRGINYLSNLTDWMTDCHGWILENIPWQLYFTEP